MTNKLSDIKNKVPKILKILLNVVIVFVCLIAFFLVYYIIMAQVHSNDEHYRPAVSLYTIVSPSMEPVIKVYDVVINTKVKSPQDIQVGDIITYISTNSASEGMTITHRVIEVQSNSDGNYEYRTQGDNNSSPDVAYVTFDNVIGKKVLTIRGLGRIQFLLADKKGWLFLLLIPVAIYIFKDIYNLINLFGLRKKVDIVTGSVEVPDRIKEKAEKKRKEEIIRKIQERESQNNSYKKSKYESDSFLEPYSETIITVGDPDNLVSIKEESKPKEPEIIPQVHNEPEPEIEKEEIVKQSEKIITKEKVAEKEEIVEKADEKVEKETAEKIEEKTAEKEPTLPKENVLTENAQNLEILDTDEMSSVIKTYTEKIAELDNALANIKKEEKQKEEPIVEEENYLKGEKIKVINMKPAKNSSHKNVGLAEQQIELKSPKIIPKPTIKKMERPQTQDIKEVNKDINPVKTTNLNQTPPSKKKINLNPNEVQKVNRNKKKKGKKVVSKKPSNYSKKTPPKKKSTKFITIKKVK